MNTLFKTAFTLTFSILLTSCSDDDSISQETANNFPVKLTLVEQIDTITFYKNGEETIPSQNELDIFYENNQEVLAEFDTNLEGSFFEFTNNALLKTNTFDDGDEATVEYNFENSILNTLGFDGSNIPLAYGSFEEIKEPLIIVYTENSTTTTFGLLANNDIFPLTFDSTKGFYHDFEYLTDISDDKSLYLFTREYIYRK